MTDIIKDFAPLFLKEIEKSNNILLHCHPSPDPDSVGSALAMKLALESINKKVTLIQGDNEIPKSFNFPGVNTIEKKSYSEINTNVFDLFISLDSNTKKMITNKQDIVFPENLKVIVIDHHKSNEGYGHINCIDSSYPATAQILFDLFKEIKIELNHDIALNLFMGIYTDTGGFKYLNNGASTLIVASELAKYAIDYPEIIFKMENSNRKQKLIFQGLALSSVKEFCNGKVAIASVSNDQLVENNIAREDILSSTIANEIKSIIDFDIAISIVEEEKGISKISIRTRDSNKYDLSKLAITLNGGGHKAAAGARLNMTINDAINKVVEQIKLIYNL